MGGEVAAHRAASLVGSGGDGGAGRRRTWQLGRQHGARFGGGHLSVGDEEDALEAVRERDALRDPLAVGAEGDLEAAERGEVRAG
eukprot:7061132-Prymnesium_polylepis.1